MSATPDMPNVEFFERIGLGLKSLGAVYQTDKPAGRAKPTSVVVERLDVLKKWAAAMVLAETARELDEFAERVERSDRHLNISLVVDALRERAEDLRARTAKP